VLFLVAILSTIVCLATALAGQGSGRVGGWAAGAWFLLAGLAGLSYLGRRLPLQNLGAVLLVALASAFIGLTLALRSSAFLGAVSYADGFGPKVLGIVPWQIPCLWLGLVLSSRETARLILRPWRRDRYYGYWLMGVAALLVLWTELALEPFALHVAGWWNFRGVIPEVHWVGVPWVVLPGSFILAVLVLGFVGPWLIVKRPIPTPPDSYPLAIWLLFNGGFLLGNLWRGLWVPAVTTLVGVGVVIVLARRARQVGSKNVEEPPRD
jgi:uncharacterized membrane protein